jgi:hypothetical protein
MYGYTIIDLMPFSLSLRLDPTFALYTPLYKTKKELIEENVDNEFFKEIPNRTPPSNKIKLEQNFHLILTIGTKY